MSKREKKVRGHIVQVSDPHGNWLDVSVHTKEKEAEKAMEAQSGRNVKRVTYGTWHGTWQEKLARKEAKQS